MIHAQENVYTDAPPLKPNLFVGSLQLFFWLFFHPTAWRTYLQRYDSTLRPDFSLIDLSVRHWRNFSFWRMLAQFFLAWPLITALLIFLLLTLLSLPRDIILLAIILGVAIGIVANVAASIAGSLVVGTAVGIGVGLVAGLFSGLSFDAIGRFGTFFAQFPAELLISTVIGLASGLAGGLAYGVANGIAGELHTRDVTYSLTRQLSGVVIGLMIGALSGWIVGGVNGRFLAGLAVGVPFGLAVGLRGQSWSRGLIGGGIITLLISFLGGGQTDLNSLGTAGTFVGFALFSILVGALFALPYTLAERIAGPGAGALAGVLGSGGGLFLFLTDTLPFTPMLIFSLIGILFGMTLAWWRPIVLYPLLAVWNGLLLRLDERTVSTAGSPHRLRWHSAFWDELQRLPLAGLDLHLLLILDRNVDEGMAAMAYLSQTRQRWAAQAAQIEVDARQLQRCQEVAAISRVHKTLAAGELSGSASALLRSFSRISQDVDAARRQESAYNQRLAFSALEDRLDGLLRELTRSSEPYAARFQPIAAQWRQIVAAESLHLAAEAEMRQEIDSPYIIGVPLTEQQEIFVGRADISARIEQLLLDRRQPPLLLYGQRRVGKTSLLHNLGRLLPSTIIPLFIDLQGPATRAKDHVGFLYNVARSMIGSAQRQRHLTLPPLSREALAADPYTRFDEWLDEIETLLNGRMLLLMFDEFEVLEQAFSKQHLDEESVMGMFRHLIQHRLRFKLLLSGSHTLDEFQQWASYLINVQVIHISYLSDKETTQLIEHPVRGFALRYEPQASERIRAVTRGHPFLVQLLCAEVVALKNEQPPSRRRLAQLKDVDAAIAPALAHGSFFFADIRQNQVGMVEREVLHFMARMGETAVTPRQRLVEFVPSLMELEQALLTLQARELIEPAADGYRFQIELVRRWFAQQPG